MALIQYDNEYMRLKRVALYKPSRQELAVEDFAANMYESEPDPAKVLVEFSGIVSKLESLGVAVVVLEDREGETENTSNMVFLRDTAFVFNQTIMLANMKHQVRMAEPKKLAKLLSKTNDSYAKYIKDMLGENTMEGADIFALAPDRLCLYSGLRTSKGTESVITRSFPGTKIQAIKANITRIPQHLLGALHIVDHDLALRRRTYCKDSIKGLAFVDFDEDTEVTHGFALNVITLGPREILMPANRPRTQARIEAAGVTCHTVEINEIHKMGGGLACMALPLERESQCL